MCLILRTEWPYVFERQAEYLRWRNVKSSLARLSWATVTALLLRGAVGGLEDEVRVVGGAEAGTGVGP